MKVLLTGSNTAFGAALAAHLNEQEGCELLLTDRTEQPGDPRTRLSAPFFLSELDDSESTHRLLEGVDQIIHVEPLSDSLPLEDDGWCDISARCTYNLLHAASELGISRCICLSSMDVFNSVSTDYVTPGPNWAARPRPIPTELGPHLAEFVCREFASAAAIPIAIARIGAPVDDLTATPLADRPRYWVATQSAIDQVTSLLFQLPPPPEAGNGNSGFFIGGGVANMYHPHRQNFAISHAVDQELGGLEPLPLPPIVPTGWAKAPTPGDRVVLYGANGMMGPQAVLALREADYSVLVTDVGSPEDKDQIERLAAAGDPIDFDGQRVTSAAVDIRDKASVWEAANGASHLVICAVSRWQRRSSFDVNMRGVMNGITAAIAAGHDRFITTGPHWTLAGAQEQLSLSYGIGEDTVPHPGAGLYGITKGLGLEIARVYSAFYPIHTICHVYNNIGITPEPGTAGSDGLDLAITFRDAGRAILSAVEVDLAKMPSSCEVFYITADLPHGKYQTDKWKNLTGWEAIDTLENYYMRPKL